MSESTGPGRHGAEGPACVLVVDDEPFVVKIAQRVLEREGFEVITASTGDETLAKLAAHPDISLILLDSSLPDTNADGVLQLMADRGFTTRVLLSSGFAEDSLPTREAFANVCGFLQKPYAVAQLVARVRELLARS